MEKRCVYCAFFDIRDEKDKIGVCRINPPVFRGIIQHDEPCDADFDGYWPEVVGDEEWCGSFCEKKV